jgi:predicted SAM-dependent methyltransferase
MKLHIGGREVHPDWKILNVQAGPGVDFVGDCLDLSQFGDDSVETVYGSHVFEHLSYSSELPQVLGECRRILVPGGELYISVPNLGVLCQMFVAESATDDLRYHVMRVMFGGQVDAYDFHKVGLIEPFLAKFLGRAGFQSYRRVPEFNIFKDSSSLRLAGHLISLNMIATK